MKLKPEKYSWPSEYAHHLAQSFRRDAVDANQRRPTTEELIDLFIKLGLLLNRDTANLNYRRPHTKRIDERIKIQVISFFWNAKRLNQPRPTNDQVKEMLIAEGLKTKNFRPDEISNISRHDQSSDNPLLMPDSSLNASMPIQEGNWGKKYTDKEKKQIIKCFNEHGFTQTKTQYHMGSNQVYQWSEQLGIPLIHQVVSGSGKGKRYSKQEKSAIIQYYDPNGFMKTLDQYEIGHNTLSNWLKER